MQHGTDSPGLGPSGRIEFRSLVLLNGNGCGAIQFTCMPMLQFENRFIQLRALGGCLALLEVSSLNGVQPRDQTDQLSLGGQRDTAIGLMMHLRIWW